MRRIPVLVASVSINTTAIPVVAEQGSNKDIDASRERWATVFQIFSASPLGRPVENTSDADVAVLPAQVSFEGG